MYVLDAVRPICRPLYIRIAQNDPLSSTLSLSITHRPHKSSSSSFPRVGPTVGGGSAASRVGGLGRRRRGVQGQERYEMGAEMVKEEEQFVVITRTSGTRPSALTRSFLHLLT